MNKGQLLWFLKQIQQLQNQEQISTHFIAFVNAYNSQNADTDMHTVTQGLAQHLQNSQQLEALLHLATNFNTSLPSYSDQPFNLNDFIDYVANSLPILDNLAAAITNYISPSATSAAASEVSPPSTPRQSSAVDAAEVSPPPPPRRDPALNEELSTLPPQLQNLLGNAMISPQIMPHLTDLPQEISGSFNNLLHSLGQSDQDKINSAVNNLYSLLIDSNHPSIFSVSTPQHQLLALLHVANAINHQQMTEVINAAHVAQANGVPEELGRYIIRCLHTPFNFGGLIQYLQSSTTTDFSQLVADAVHFAQAPTLDVAQQAPTLGVAQQAPTFNFNHIHPVFGSPHANNHPTQYANNHPIQLLPPALQTAFNQVVNDRPAVVGSSSSNDGRPGSSNDGNNNPGGSPGGSSTSGASASSSAGRQT